MNREIKFRAWDGDVMLKNIPIEAVTLAGELDFYGTSLKVMQYTGLKDKNGKEIYEGDIGKWVNEHGHTVYEIGIVAWYCGGLWFCKDKGGQDCIGIVHKEWEIIGNIYENPELLANEN